MKRFTTILCSIAFLISGAFLALRNIDIGYDKSYNTISAATLPQYQTPQFGNSGVVLPLDLLLDQAKKNVSTNSDVTSDDVNLMIQDSLKNRIKYLESKKQVTKVKWRTAPAPPPIVKETIIHDTVRSVVHVPVYYLATQKTEPGDCIQVYEVKQVDEICKDGSQ